MQLLFLSGTIIFALASSAITFDTQDNAALGVPYAGQHGADWNRIIEKFDQSLLRYMGFQEAASVSVALQDGPHGVAIIDIDNDGDEDIYVTNGKGGDNKLYLNELAQTGVFHYQDITATAGAAALNLHDSSGVCYGDFNNDGYNDIVVMAWHGYPKLLINDQNGGFTDQSLNAGFLVGDESWYTSCAVGDIDNDGALDVVFASHADETQPLYFCCVLHDLFYHNTLMRNNGDGTFTDITASSGLLATEFPNPASNGNPSLTWAITMVDLNQDGYVDIVNADDHITGTLLMPDRAFLNVWINNGDGTFSLSYQSQKGGWMGLDFGDLNQDGILDMFATNFGKYMASMANGNTITPIQVIETRWFMGEAGGVTFEDSYFPSASTYLFDSMNATPFGWGCHMVDYDNDGDFDIVGSGNMMMFHRMLKDNIGWVYENDLAVSGKFIPKTAPFKDGTNTEDRMTRANVYGMASGDINGDGFPDMVAVSTLDIPDPSMLQQTNLDTFNSVFDENNVVWQHYDYNYVNAPFPPPVPVFATLEYNQVDLIPGTLNVMTNSGNDNEYIKIRLRGTFNVNSNWNPSPGGPQGFQSLGNAATNAFGAVMWIDNDCDGVDDQMKPLLGGSGFLSQNSEATIFGFGASPATNSSWLTVLYPGGNKNRWTVPSKKKATMRFPEMPCEFGVTANYCKCVRQGLRAVYNSPLLNVLWTEAELKALAKDPVLGC